MYSHTQEDHFTHLQAVHDQFAQHRLKLKLLKCHFFKEDITYLGHEISATDMLLGQEAIDKIARMGLPTMVTCIQMFIRAVGYFWKFIKNCVHIARPLDELVSYKNSKLKNHPVLFMPAALEVFEMLKKKCIMVSAFANLEKLFILETEASGIGLGAVLLQEQDYGKLYLVVYASRAGSHVTMQLSATHSLG